LNSPFDNVALTVTSTVSAAAFPDIDGSYTATDSSVVHLEKYCPGGKIFFFFDSVASTWLDWH